MSNKISKNAKPYPRLYTLHSQKGGVGKTSIAIAIGSLEAIYHGKKTIIIDADMTGTSLVDVFPSSLEHVRYLNEVILAPPAEFEKYTSILSRPEGSSHDLSSLWQKIPQCELYYIPSSPMLRDIQRVVPLISQEDYLGFFKRRLEDFIVATLNDNFDVIIIDHGPGLFGLSTTSINMALDHITSQRATPKRLARLMQMVPEKGALSVNCVLVATPDPVDHNALLSSFSKILEDRELDKETEVIGRTLTLINNKSKAKIGERFDPYFATQRIFDSQDKIAPERQMSHSVREALLKKAKETGAISCQYVLDFDMDQITLTVSALKSSKDLSSVSSDLANWCWQVGMSVGILKPREFVRP